MFLRMVGEYGHRSNKLYRALTKRRGRGFLYRYTRLVINPLPNDKIIPLSKLNAFADNKIIVTKKLKFIYVRVVNIVKKDLVGCTGF